MNDPENSGYTVHHVDSMSKIVKRVGRVHSLGCINETLQGSFLLLIGHKALAGVMESRHGEDGKGASLGLVECQRIEGPRLVELLWFAWLCLSVLCI